MRPGRSSSRAPCALRRRPPLRHPCRTSTRTRTTALPARLDFRVDGSTWVLVRIEVPRLYTRIAFRRKTFLGTIVEDWRAWTSVLASAADDGGENPRRGDLRRALGRAPHFDPVVALCRRLARP